MNALETIRQAIEALEKHVCYASTTKEWLPNKAVVDLRALLADMEKAKPVAWYGESLGWTDNKDDAARWAEDGQIVTCYYLHPTTDAKDAARYRWLKANHLQTGIGSWIRTGDDLEEAIDAAMDARA